MNLHEAILEGRLDITIQNLHQIVDTVFERRMKRYEAYSQSSNGINAASSEYQGSTNQRETSHGILETGNESEELG
jgi:hypothetical protein